MLTLVALTFFSAMLITNDVALVTFVPFAIAVLIMAGQEDKTILVATLMTIGANVGSMLTPVGNAHNLYLKALTEMSTKRFIGIMAPYSFTAAILLVIVISVVFGSKPVGDLGDLETGVLAPERSKHQPMRSASPVTAPVTAKAGLSKASVDFKHYPMALRSNPSFAASFSLESLGAYPMTAPSLPATVQPLMVRRGLTPRASAFSLDMTTTAAAPSFRLEELPRSHGSVLHKTWF